MPRELRTDALSNPIRLRAKGEDPHTVQVVIETPKGSHNKYAFDPDLRVFTLKKVLPAGMAFPWDFGFVPSTIAEDGDPLDVLVLMDEPAFPGCLLQCRLIGIIRGRQKADDGWEENDRLIAVEANNHTFAAIDHVDDLGKRFLKELEDFFVNYHELDDARFEVTGAGGPSAARKRLRQAKRQTRKT